MSYSRQDWQLQKKVQINGRDGPIKERSCTDILCCLLYILLVGSIIFLAIFANNTMQKTALQIQTQLQNVSQASPLLAITQALKYILFSLACVVALCFILLLISFIIPSFSAYIIIPLTLLVMLLLGAGFLYRFFGNKLPFVSQQIQDQYAATNSVMALFIGLAFLIGFAIALFIFITKQQRIKFVVASLSLAKLCFWDNVYMIFISFGLSIVSILALYFNVRFLEISELQSNGQKYIDNRIFSLLIIIEMLWTHGYLQAYSDFLFESIAIHWYFNETKFPGGYSTISKNLIPSLGLSFQHIGTIIFGWILAYIPESLNVLLHQCQQKAQSCYNICCVCHKCFCQHLSKYCYIGTIMYSKSFCQSSRVVKDIRATAKHTFPELYMIGNFYITLMKIFVVFTSMIICYFFLAEHPTIYGKLTQLIAPLIVTLLASLEIANHFMNATGLVGDTIYLTYVIDYSNQNTNFGNMNAEHCPPQAYEIIRQSKIGKYAQYE